MADRVDVSVVVPLLNEEATLEELVTRIRATLAARGGRYEMVFVDDGSQDRTMEAVRAAHVLDRRVDAISFSRNFGKELAMTAGIDHCDADAVVMIDADLQDPPELIAQFVQLWREGYDVVYGRRRTRAGESRFKLATAG